MPEYKQCTTIGTFDSALMEFLYFLFVMVMSLVLPFIIMLYSYLVIIFVISRSPHSILRFFVFMGKKNKRKHVILNKDI